VYSSQDAVINDVLLTKMRKNMFLIFK